MGFYQKRCLFDQFSLMSNEKQKTFFNDTFNGLSNYSRMPSNTNMHAKTFKKTYSKLNIHIHFDQKHIDHFLQFRDMFRTKNNFEIPHHKKTMHNPHHLSIHTSKDFC